MPVTQKLLDEIALSGDEYRLAVARLGREPNTVELGMIGALWSEHCGYKHSKPLLRLFPTEGPRVLTKVGEENAGVVDIGDGLVAAMKIESHNHPSAIEPYEGAATGVGGIVRDIFAMGAYPIALMNSLRFGPLSEPRNRYLFGGVVAGIAGYGNCLGIPDVGGEVFFAPAYSQNPLVNALCLGIAQKDRLVSARASGTGNLLMLVGADTGRDGLHGATFASVELNEASEERRPAVQVGNPFLEKLLMEACCELAGSDWLVGMQDLGAAGLTSSAVESAARAGSGLEIDVLKVPRREESMTAYEVMLSESQERMLLIVKKGCEDEVKAVFDRFDLHSEIIGYVTDDGRVRIKEGDQVVAELPVGLLTDPPLYRLQGVRPPWLKGLRHFDLAQLPDLARERGAKEVLLKLLASPNIASKEWVYRQYDHEVQTNTVVGPGGDAAVLRLKGTHKALALTTDGNGRYCYLNPFGGGAMAVAEAARNLVCSGAQPLAVTDCLNFGNPEKVDIYYQLEECIKGMAEACRVLGVPVISGNVSLYNETSGEAVYPTPVVGMLGLLEDVGRRCTLGFKDEGDVVVLLGPAPGGNAQELAGSEYLAELHGLVAGRPYIDLDVEKAVQELCLAAIGEGIIKSAHDCSDGGLAVALAECCIQGGIGLSDELGALSGRLDTFLFGEGPSRIVVSVARANLERLEQMAQRQEVTIRRLGVVAGKRLTLSPYLDVSLAEMRGVWRGGLEEALKRT